MKFIKRLKSLNKRKLGLVFAGLLALGVLGTQGKTALKAHLAKQAIEEAKHDPIIRIVASPTKRCSAFVVSDEYAITASHCVRFTEKELEDATRYYFEQALKLSEAEKQVQANPLIAMLIGPQLQAARQKLEVLGKELEEGNLFVVVNNKSQDTGVRAVGIERGGGRDYAILKGNFKDFKKLKMLNDKQGIFFGNYYKTCGYTGNSKNYVCTEFVPKGANYFFIYGPGQIYPGMSGGPVIDANGNAVGVNTGVWTFHESGIDGISVTTIFSAFN